MRTTKTTIVREDGSRQSFVGREAWTHFSGMVVAK